MVGTWSRLVPCLVLSAWSLCALECAPPGGAGGDRPLTYYRDGAALLARYCVDCHQRGGIAPLPLTEYGAVRAAAPLMARAVRRGEMPPWMPSSRGLPLRRSRAMVPAERELLLRWLDEGAALGAPGETPRQDLAPREPVLPVRADLVLDPGVVYRPRGDGDDYRCFPMDPFAAGGGQAPDGDLYVTGGEVRPGDRRVVHHVIVAAIPPRGAARVRARDEADPGPGYACFGDLAAEQLDGEDVVQTVLGWEAPDGGWLRPAPGTAIRVRRGSLLVLQIHYSQHDAVSDGDRSRAVLELSPTAPERTAFVVPLSDPPGLRIPAWADDAGQRFTVSVGAIERAMPGLCGKEATCDLLVHGNFPHMHYLGKSITTSVVRGPILLEIPRWDYDWQGAYEFQAPLRLRAWDILAVECRYDNSGAAQPVIGGMRQQPRDVGWGLGALDEMCLSYLFVTRAVGEAEEGPEREAP